MSATGAADISRCGIHWRDRDHQLHYCAERMGHKEPQHKCHCGVVAFDLDQPLKPTPRKGK